MNAPVPDPALIACHIDESAGMDPTVEGNEPVYDDERQAVAHWIDRNYGPAVRALYGGHDWLAAADDLLELVHAARPATPATPAVDAGTSEVGTGAQGGAGEVGLEAALRGLADGADGMGDMPFTVVLLGQLADRADALEGALRAVVSELADVSDAKAEALARSRRFALLVAERDIQVERVRALADGTGSGFPYVQVADLRAIVGGTQ